MPRISPASVRSTTSYRRRRAPPSSDTPGVNTLDGYTDAASAASADAGRAMLEVLVERITRFLRAFADSVPPESGH